MCWDRRRRKRTSDKIRYLMFLTFKKKEKKVSMKKPCVINRTITKLSADQSRKKIKRKAKQVDFFCPYLNFPFEDCLTDCFSPCLWDETRRILTLEASQLLLKLQSDLWLAGKSDIFLTAVKCPFPFAAQDRMRCASKLFQESCRE